MTTDSAKKTKRAIAKKIARLLRTMPKRVSNIALSDYAVLFKAAAMIDPSRKK